MSDLALSAPTLNKWMKYAIELAEQQLGATAPNPPVGALILNSEGELIGQGSHQKAGAPHAEIEAFRSVPSTRKSEMHTLFVTLEPCAHFGKTPPCLNAILDSPIKKVVIGVRDPNPATGGKSVSMLRMNGIEVIEDILSSETAQLIQGFTHWIKTKTPWITLKTAHQPNGSMIPPRGLTTFASQASLTLAHQLRKRSDAIITGSGTVLADNPQFTVRHVSDHPEKVRFLVLMDRRKRICEAWKKQSQNHGFQLVENLNLQEVKAFLGSQGCHHALVEAGPTLSQVVIEENFCDEQVKITQVDTQNGRVDQVSTRKGSECSLVS